MIFVPLEALALIIAKGKSLQIMNKRLNMLKRMRKAHKLVKLWLILYIKVLIICFSAKYRPLMKKIKSFGHWKILPMGNSMTILGIFTQSFNQEYMVLLQLVHLFLTQIWIFYWHLTHLWLFLMIFLLI